MFEVCYKTLVIFILRRINTVRVIEPIDHYAVAESSRLSRWHVVLLIMC